MENILVINAGSSSVKLSVFNVIDNDLSRKFNVRAVRLFHEDALISIYDENKKLLVEKDLADISVDPPNHKVAIEFFMGWLSQQSGINLIAVAHRVVHGGPKYSKPVVITDDVEKELHSYRLF